MIITAKRLGALAVVAVLGSSGYAFMNANTVAMSGAGSGQGPVYGYNIAHITYSVAGANGGCYNGDSPADQNNPNCIIPGKMPPPPPPMGNPNAGRIVDVSFSAIPQITGEPAAVNAFAALNDSNGNMVSPWVACSQTSIDNSTLITTWNCQFSSPQALHAPTSLDVRATS